jgi:hypothetical protein
MATSAPASARPVAAPPSPSPRPGTPTASVVAGQPAAEGKAATFRVRLSFAPDHAASVDFDAWTDIPFSVVIESGIARFAAGVQDVVVNVPTIDDGLDEPTETIRMNLRRPKGLTAPKRYLAAVTVLDNDPTPRLSIDALEGGALKISLTHASGHDISFDVKRKAGTVYGAPGTRSFVLRRGRSEMTIDTKNTWGSYAGSEGDSYTVVNVTHATVVDGTATVPSNDT